jgi:ABC-2 type transport system ATP-binding protein
VDEALFDGRPYQDPPCPVREVGAVLDAKAFHPRHSAPKRLRMLASAGRAPSAVCGRVPDRRVDQVLARSAWLRWRASRRGFSLRMAQRFGLAAAVLAAVGPRHCG